jgi:hypothetical protein
MKEGSVRPDRASFRSLAVTSDQWPAELKRWSSRDSNGGGKVPNRSQFATVVSDIPIMTYSRLFPKSSSRTNPIVTRRKILRVDGDSGPSRSRISVVIGRGNDTALIRLWFQRRTHTMSGGLNVKLYPAGGNHDPLGPSEETPNVRPMVIVESSGPRIAAGGPVRLTDAHCLL